MHKRTYDDFIEAEYNYASKLENPIKYILSISKMNIIIDNSLPVGFVEKWGSPDDYKEFLKQTNEIGLDDFGDNEDDDYDFGDLGFY